MFPRLSETALAVLIPFATTRICEPGFGPLVKDEIWISLEYTGRHECYYQQHSFTF